jgi:hypothetical protein
MFRLIFQNPQVFSCPPDFSKSASFSCPARFFKIRKFFHVSPDFSKSASFFMFRLIFQNLQKANDHHSRISQCKEQEQKAKVVKQKPKEESFSCVRL